MSIYVYAFLVGGKRGGSVRASVVDGSEGDRKRESGKGKGHKAVRGTERQSIGISISHRYLTERDTGSERHRATGRQRGAAAQTGDVCIEDTNRQA